jgi:hypothetical protein
VGQVIEEAPGVVFVVMLDAMGGGPYRGVRKAGVEGQWELAFPGDGFRGFRCFKVSILHASLVLGQYTGGACVFQQGVMRVLRLWGAHRGSIGQFCVFAFQRGQRFQSVYTPCEFGVGPVHWGSLRISTGGYARAPSLGGTQRPHWETLRLCGVCVLADDNSVDFFFKSK